MGFFMARKKNGILRIWTLFLGCNRNRFSGEGRFELQLGSSGLRIKGLGSCFVRLTY